MCRFSHLVEDFFQTSILCLQLQSEMCRSCQTSGITAVKVNDYLCFRGNQSSNSCLPLLLHYLCLQITIKKNTTNSSSYYNCIDFVTLLTLWSYLEMDFSRRQAAKIVAASFYYQVSWNRTGTNMT